MIGVETALQLVEKNILEQKYISVKLDASLNCVLSKDIISPINMPPFQQSAMDGYALNLCNTSVYTIIDEVKAGDGHNPILKNGEAIKSRELINKVENTFYADLPKHLLEKTTKSGDRLIENFRSLFCIISNEREIISRLNRVYK